MQRSLQNMDLMGPVQEIVQNGPPPITQPKDLFTNVCTSNLGLAALSVLLFFTLLLLIQPSYVLTKGPGEYDSAHLNYTITIGISIICGVLVYVVPKFFA